MAVGDSASLWRTLAFYLLFGKRGNLIKRIKWTWVKVEVLISYELHEQ